MELSLRLLGSQPAAWWVPEVVRVALGLPAAPRRAARVGRTVDHCLRAGQRRQQPPPLTLRRPAAPPLPQPRRHSASAACLPWRRCRRPTTRSPCMTPGENVSLTAARSAAAGRLCRDFVRFHQYRPAGRLLSITRGSALGAMRSCYACALVPSQTRLKLLPVRPTLAGMRWRCAAACGASSGRTASPCLDWMRTRCAVRWAGASCGGQGCSLPCLWSAAAKPHLRQAAGEWGCIRWTLERGRCWYGHQRLPCSRRCQAVLCSSTAAAVGPGMPR